jgi:hypothetical protein
VKTFNLKGVKKPPLNYLLYTHSKLNTGFKTEAQS